MKPISLPGLFDVSPSDKAAQRRQLTRKDVLAWKFREGLRVEDRIPAFRVEVFSGPEKIPVWQDSNGASVMRALLPYERRFDLIVRIPVALFARCLGDYLVSVCDGETEQTLFVSVV